MFFDEHFLITALVTQNTLLIYSTHNSKHTNICFPPNHRLKQWNTAF